MTKKRLPGDESRIRLIEAAAQIIREEGYAALSARTLTERVGLKRQIVHYYFGTIEELLIAVVRHYGEMGLQRCAAALSEGDVLRVMLDMEADASATTFAFMAMAQHRPAIREELRHYRFAFRDLQVAAIERYAVAQGIEFAVPASTIWAIIQGVALGLTGEMILGKVVGQADVRADVEKLILHAVK